nr:putative AC transposase [Tanacetum cinerariifolium]
MLSVQATFIAFESAFSTSGQVLSIRRTRLTPASLEMCMCLKDHLDAQDRIQNTLSIEHSIDFEEDILEEEVQDNETIPLFDKEIALDEATSEAMFNGSSSGGEDDMLSVQATFIGFESAFSTSGQVLSIRRTRLIPASLEMCMCLKDHLDAQDRIQNTLSIEHSIDFEEDILEEEVQDNETIPLSDKEIALDEATSEAMFNGSSSGGEDVDLTLSD